MEFGEQQDNLIDHSSFIATHEPQYEVVPAHTSSFEDALHALTLPSEPIFAILDGAQFDNLPHELMMGGYISRTLYLDRGDNNPSQIVTAPHMVWLDERLENPLARGPQETIPDLLELIANRPAAVFWQSPDGADALYKHLRGINMVIIPRDFAPPDNEEPSGEEILGDHGTNMTVLFRHADANVIAQTLPSLNASEMSRFFGPASTVLFKPHADWSAGQEWIVCTKPENLPVASHGLLKLSAETLQRIQDSRSGDPIHMTADYLRRTLPANFQNLSDEQLERFARESRQSGEELGLRSLGAHQRWAFLMAVTNGRIAQDGNIRDFISSGAETPDHQVRELMRRIFRQMRKLETET